MNQNTITVRGQRYPVENIAELPSIQAQLATLMKARGFDAYGTVHVPGDEATTVYRAVRTGAWQIIQRVRS